MATIETKYVDVGTFTFKTSTQYGFNHALSVGTISDTANGSSNRDISGIFSSTNVRQLTWFNSNQVSFMVDGTKSNSGFDSITIGSQTYYRSAATHNAPGGSDPYTTWTWSSTTNPFGTTVGADILVTWDDGQAGTTAPVISSVTNNNASASSVTTTVNLSSNGSGGTLKYAQSTSSSVPATGWQTSNQFTHPRNSIRYYWASQDEDTSGTYDDSGAIYVGYIAPDTNISVSRSPTGNLAYDSTGNVTVTISNGTVGDTYRVLRTSPSNLGCGNTGSLTGTSGTVSLDYSVSGELPPAGSTYSYTIQAKRDTANGGDGVYDNTGTNFSITRNSDTIPDAFTFTDVTGVSQSTTQTSNTITVSGMTSGASASVTVSGGTYSKNGGAYTSAVGTASNGDTFAVRHTSGGDFSTSVSTTLNIGGVSDTYTSTTAAFGGSTYYVDVSGTYDGELNTIFLFVTGTGAGGTQANPKRINPGDRVGFKKAGSPTVVAKLFNSAHWTDSNNITLGTSYTYKYAKSTIPTTIADAVTVEATYSGATNSSIQWFIGESGITAPVISSVSTDNAAAANVTATVNLSSNGSGGTLKFAQTTTNSVPATGWQTSASFAHPRGTTRYYWASQDEDSGYAYDGPKTVTIGYLLPDLAVSATSSTISGSATTATTNVTNGNTTDTYAVRVNNGTVNLASRTGNGSMTWSTNLPGNGGTVTYEIFSRRPTSTGGNGTTFYQTNDTFTVTRELTPTAPTDIVFSADPGTESATVSITATASGGVTGTLQVSENNSTWVANGSSFTFTRGTAKTIYARRINGSTPSTSYSESNTIGYLSPDLAVAATSSTIAYNATSATTTISGGQADENYAVRLNNGSTNIATRLGNGNITFTSNLPAQGVSTTYEIFAQLPTNIGGSGVYTATNDTFTVERQVADNIPDQFTFTDVTGVALSTTQTSNTITVAGVQVSASVSITGGTYSKNGGAYTNASTTAVNGDTFAVRHTSSGSFSTATNTTLTIGGVSDTYTSTTLAADTTPNQFTFNDYTGVARSTTQTSNTITVGGLNTSTSVSITGGNYSKNGGGYTSATTTAVNGDTFTLQHTSSANFSTTVNTTLNIGGVTDTFSSTTLAIDSTPDAFTFTDVTGVALSTTQTSNTITVSGINTSVAVSVSGGTYSKNGGAYTSSAGTASNGDTFAVRHTSSSNFSTAVNTTLNIGGVTDTYTSTTAAFTGSTFYVDANATDLQEGFTFLAVSGTGVSTSSSSPKLLEAGDRVGFKITSGSDTSFTVKATGFNSTHWTNTGFLTLTTSYQYKYASSTIPVSVYDDVTVTATKTGNETEVKTLYFMGDSLQPNLTVELDEDVYEITTSATSHTIVISNTGSSTNSSITQYKVVDQNGASHESRTGPGTLVVTDVPPNDGFPKYYSLQARITTANGGSGLWQGVPGTSYSVIATTTATGNDPTIDNYGIAIYDHNGDPVTSFTEGHSTLRELYSNNSVTLSTTAVTDVSTGLSGITTSNCVIMVEGASTSGASSSPQVTATFVGTNPVSVRLGRVQYSQSVKVTVAQYKGNTIGETSSFGFQVRNGNNDAVIDEHSIVYGVREIIALNPSASNQTLAESDTTSFLYVTLTQGRYPASGGLPIPAISSSKSVVLMPPTITGVKHPDGSYKTVICYIPKGITINGNYNLAMLVSSDNETPSYFGGSEPDYGIEIYNTSDEVIWHSGWRQAIVNNVVSANQFTAGTNQNGTYDVTTGYDGVLAPLSTEDDTLDSLLNSRAQTVGISSLNQMDPANTYLIGTTNTGNVAYYKGRFYNPEFGIDQQAGGGMHKPGIRITSTTSASITMYRYRDGPNAPTSSDYGTRVSTSYHPEGDFVLVRIV